MELEDIERFLQENDLLKLKKKLSKYIYNNSEIEVKDFIDKIELNYLPNIRINIEANKATFSKMSGSAVMTMLLNIKIEKLKFLENWVKENRELKLIEKPKYDHIFAKNGFVLFEYLLENAIKKKDKKGHYRDLFYFYRRLYNDNYIHQRPKPFFDWYNDKYDEVITQYKTLIDAYHIDRFNFYSMALVWFKGNYK